MKFSVTRSSIINALSHAYSISDANSSIFAFSTVYIAAYENQIILKSFNSDFELHETFESASIEQEGFIVVSSDILYNIIRKIRQKEGIILFELDNQGQTLSIQAGKSSFKLTQFYQQQTEIGNEDGNSKIVTNLLYEDRSYLKDMSPNIRIDAGKLLYLLSSISHAMPMDHPQNSFNGICLDINEEKIVSVATDGHRIASVSYPFQATSMKLIIPSRNVSEIVKILGNFDSNDEVNLYNIHNSKLLIVGRNISIGSKLIDGNYPKYQNFIPQSSSYQISVMKNDFQEMIDRVSTIASYHKYSISLSISQNSIEAYSIEDGIGNSNDSIEIESRIGIIENSITLRLNAQYLLIALKNIDEEYVILNFGQKEDPILIHGLKNDVNESENQLNKIDIIMPMRF